MAFVNSFNNNVAAQISNISVVNCFNVTTFDVEHWSSQDIFLLLSVDYVKTQAP